jgi:hypothetical protein
MEFAALSIGCADLGKRKGHQCHRRLLKLFTSSQLAVFCVELPTSQYVSIAFFRNQHTHKLIKFRRTVHLHSVRSLQNCWAKVDLSAVSHDCYQHPCRAFRTGTSTLQVGGLVECPSHNVSQIFSKLALLHDVCSHIPTTPSASEVSPLVKA